MISGRLMDLVDAAWADGLGCDVDLVREPGVHLVPGGGGLQGYDAVYMARIGDAVLVYCPEALRRSALDVLGTSPPEEVFTAGTVERIAGGRLDVVLGPAWHGYADGDHFVAYPEAQGEQLSLDDPRLAALRRACGEDEWAEAGFLSADGAAYGLDAEGRLVAAGNMTPFRGRLAAVGLLTHPDHRGRGLARRLASRMVGDALPDAEVVRYRALTANAASLAVARSLGFVGRGENIVGRLRAPTA